MYFGFMPNHYSRLNLQGHAAKLGQADSGDLRSGPPYVPRHSKFKELGVRDAAKRALS